MLITALALLKGFVYIGQGLLAFFIYVIIKPARAIGLFLFHYLFIHLYRLYLIIKKWLSAIFAPAKNKIIYPLLHKSTIHFVLIVIGIAIVANNLFIRETKAEEFGAKTIIGKVVISQEDQDIVESALASQPKTTDYYQRLGLLTPEEAAPSNTSAGESSGNIITSENSAAVVKPTLTGTTEGDRPREQVVYYIVEGGDTVSTIAEKFNISTDTILWENKLGPRDYIKPGDKLTILPISGIAHQIKKGDNMQKIADKYKVAADEIIAFNNLVDASAIDENEILIIPGGQMPEEAPTPRPATEPSRGFAIFNIPPSAKATGGAKLLWPTPSHRINQYFKYRHTGLDIDGDYSSPVYAADDGRVEASGWGGGYGNRIIINHGGGVKSLYGHESKIFVRVGDSVKKGQTIGMVGCTGRCTGTHVHFEVIVNGSKVNPLSRL